VTQHNETQHNDNVRIVRDLLDSTMTNVDAPTARIEQAARAQGTRLRARRRTGGVVGIAAVAAVAALAAPSLAHGLGGGGGEHGVAASPSPTPEANYDPPADDSGWWDMPAPEMLDRLTGLLPDNLKVTDAVTMNDDRAPEEPYGPMHGWLSANLERTSAERGGVNVVLYPPPSSEPEPTPVTTTDGNGDEHTTVYADGPDNQQRINCPGNLVDPDQCTELRDAAGHHYGRASESRTEGVVVSEVTILTGDGGVVYVAAANTTDPKWGAGATITADEPLLDLTRLETITSDPTWQDWTPPASPSPGPSSDPTGDVNPQGTPTSAPTEMPSPSTTSPDEPQGSETSMPEPTVSTSGPESPYATPTPSGAPQESPATPSESPAAAPTPSG